GRPAAPRGAAICGRADGPARSRRESRSGSRAALGRPAAAGRAGPCAREHAGRRARRRADREPRLGGCSRRAPPLSGRPRSRTDAGARHARRQRRLRGGPGDHAARRAGRGRDGARRGTPGSSVAPAEEGGMTATLVRLAFAGIRSRLLASALTIVIGAAAVATIVIALEVRSAGVDPWQRTFDAANGAHVLAFAPTRSEALRISELPGV